MIVGNRNDKSLTYEMDNGVSNLELSKVTDGLSNSQVDDLIDTLCKVRNENPDTLIMDEIKKGNNPPINPIELEKINEQREYDSVEMEIIENMIDSGDMSIEEMNMMKANGFYDRYTKYKESKGDIDMMDSIEEEIKNTMMEEDNMNETIETPITEEEVKEESFPETTVEDVENSDTSTTEENTETVEDDDRPMTDEELNDVPASTLEVEDQDIISKVKKSYSNIDDQDVIDLLNVMKRYQSGEKFNVYEALPKVIRVEIDKAALESGVTDKSIINFFAKNFINDLISDTYMGKEIEDFQKEMEELTAPMGNIPGLIIDTYTDDLKVKFEDKMLELADNIQEENAEKAETLREIAANFKSSYTLDKIKKTLEEKPSLANRAYKDGRDKYETYKRDFNDRFKDTKPRVKPFESINNALKFKLGYSDDYAKAFSVLVYNSIMAEDDGSVKSHIYAYYLMLGFININLTANNSEIMKTFCENIYGIMHMIETYMESIKSNKKKKVNKRK